MPAKGQTIVHSEETRRRISESVKRAYAEGRLVAWATGLTKADPRLKGFLSPKKLSDETKAKISASRKGKALGNKNRLGLAPYNKGQTHPVHNSEWRAKVSAANAGSKHWNWKGGIASENRLMRNSAAHKEWAREVMRRDRWTCQKCDATKRRELVAHHVVPWSKDRSLRFAVSNGLTLCRSCHAAHHRFRLGTGKTSKAPNV